MKQSYWKALLVATGLAASSLLAQAPGLSQDWAAPSPTRSWGVGGLLGGGLNYSALNDAAGGEVRSYSIPVILPLEVSLGRLYMGGAFEYAVQEYRSAAGSSNAEGPHYAGLLLGYQLFHEGRWQIEWNNRTFANIANENGQLNGPEYAWLANERYRLDNELAVRYQRERANVRMGLAHNLRTERDGYDPGETSLASLAFGYGFGDYSPEARDYQLTVLLGVNARYNFADRKDNARVAGTEYGTVFVAPGLQIATRTLSLQAMVEVPVQQLQPDEQSIREELRANFGMRYYLR
ncbi:MAG: hypothetical protein K1X75_10775 [Leptospirales bacterium]|nr:hypothetical protein [Leptospirales bacterium]